MDMTKDSSESIFGVSLKFSGEDGNAFFIIGRAQRAARDAGISKEEIDEFLNEAMDDDYDHLLQTCMKYFDVS